MRNTLTLVFVGLSLHMAIKADETRPPGVTRPLDCVNILQGTDSNFDLSHGNTLPLVGVPWGMTDWSIENATGNWFFHPVAKIDGFRATHQPSPWMGDYGQFVLMPQSGELRLDAGARMVDYDAGTSVLGPDYEKLELKGERITAELTATERCAVFRFTFGRGGPGRLIVDAGGPSGIEIVGRAVRGFSRANTGGVPGGFATYFVIELDRDITGKAVIVGHGAPGESGEASSYVEFAALPGERVEARVGTSFIGWEQAERNLRAETAGGFDAVRTRVRETWNSRLGRIEIEAPEDRRRTFYSCLYHALMFPHRLHEIDADGKTVHASPYDGRIHEGVLYGDIGLWDAFRTTFPLLSLLYPAQLGEILQGFVNASAEGGTLPEWPSPGYRDCMIGQHSAAIFADAATKGITGFDLGMAYDSLRRSAFEPPAKGDLVRKGLADYLRLGYVPDCATTYAVSTSLDYVYDDWCVAQIARLRGRTGDYDALMARAQNYRRLWDPGVGFMRPRDEAGRWVGTFDPFAWGGPYAEGGPWQSSWFVPHDPAGLAGLLGGRERLAGKLDEMLRTPPIFHFGGYGHVIHEMTEMGNAGFGQYAQCNQPVFHVLYLYAFAGQPWKTEYWTRRVCAGMFDATERGFPGDEDNGSMASWYLLSSIGLFPLCPGNPAYVLGSPLFSKVTLHPSQAGSFVITASSQGDGNVYVRRRTLNGAVYTRTWIAHADIAKGGELSLDMGPEPDTRTVAVADLPYSASPP